MFVKIKQTEVAYPVAGWKFVIEERLSSDGTGFWAFKVGIYENARKKPCLIGVFITFAEAKAAAEKRHRQTEAAMVW